MIEITHEVYRAVAARLTEATADSDFFNGTLEIDSDELYATLTLTAIVYRRTEMFPEGPRRVMADIVPVWWEFATVQECGEVINDFSFAELKKYLFR